MSIVMRCPNGHKGVVSDEHAGVKVMCPKCRAIFMAPIPLQSLPNRPVNTDALAPVEEEEKTASVGAKRPGGHASEKIISEEELPVKLAGPASERVYEIDDEDTEPPVARKVHHKEEDDEEQPEVHRRRKRRRADLRRALGPVNLGLGLHYARLVIWIICAFVLVLIGLTAQLWVQSAAGAILALIVLLVTWGVMLVMPLVGLVGSLLCFWVPAPSARLLIMVSFALDLGSIPVALVLYYAISAVLMPLVAGAMSVAAFLLFLLFLRQLALYVREAASAAEAISLIVFFVVLALSYVGYLVLLHFLVSQLHGAGGIIGLVLGIALIVAVVKFLFRILNLIGSLRQVIRARYGV